EVGHQHILVLEDQIIDQGVEKGGIFRAEITGPEKFDDGHEARILIDVFQRIVTGRALGHDLLGGQAEQEEILGSHLFADFDVGAVEGAYGQGTVDRELHVTRAAGLFAGGGNLLGQVAGREYLLRQGNPVILEKDHLEQVARVGIGIDHVGHRVDELDDELGQEISRRRLAPENEGARHDAGGPARLDLVVKVDDVQNAQKLALVFVDALY